MTKTPVTIRLSEDTLEEIDAEADERGFGSRTDYLRWIINNRDSIDENLVHRLEKLEDRVARVENNQSE